MRYVLSDNTVRSVLESQYHCNRRSGGDMNRDTNIYIPDGKVHGANMGPIWSRQDPGGPHVDPMDFAIWDE